MAVDLMWQKWISTCIEWKEPVNLKKDVYISITCSHKISNGIACLLSGILAYWFYCLFIGMSEGIVCIQWR